MAQKYIEDDLVMTRTEPNNFTPNGVVCKFGDYIATDKVLIRPINGIDRFIVEKGQIVPIPLTPEILEKNGWRKEQENYFNDSYHIFLECKYEKYSAYKVVHNNVVWLRDVRSVSDLQHLLFGLGINQEMEV